MNPAENEADRRAELLAEFPSLERGIYLNHAAVSPWPTCVRQAVESFARQNNLHGPESFPDWLRNEQDLHERYARIIGAADSSEIALVSNTTEGIATVANGLDWKPGDNLVTVKGEFPSNRMSWLSLQDQGVAVREVDVRASHDAEQSLLNAMDNRTRALVVSSVQWTDGFRLNLAQLGEACRHSDALFFVDAIQQLGALRIDVQASRVDCLVAGSHKWQMAPEGLGVFYCRDAWRERIKPLKLGWRMLKHPYLFDQPNREISATGRRFEPGTPNTTGQFALNAALSLQEKWGQEWIEQRVLQNARILADGIDRLNGCRVVSQMTPERRSGIVSFHPGKHDPKALVKALAQHQVTAIARGEWIRMSPHFYQEPGLMDEALKRLEQCLK